LSSDTQKATASDTDNSDSAPAALRRIAIGVEYNGADFHGWQRQTKPPVATIQMAVEDALCKVADQKITLICAGRTDAGVHATGQVAHFEVSNERELKAWTMGVNSLLPSAIRVVWAKEVDTDFHARFSASARRYQYWIHNAAVRPGIFSSLMTHCSKPLNESLMHQAAQALVGEQDFTSFRAIACESKTAMRNVHAVSVKRHGERICIEIEANAFLLHMVRNIAGTLMAVGTEKQPVNWVKTLLLAKNRALAAATAKPDGLYLMAVTYPAKYDLPEAERSLF